MDIIYIILMNYLEINVIISHCNIVSSIDTSKYRFFIFYIYTYKIFVSIKL